MKLITMKFVAAVFAVLFAATTLAAEDLMPTIQEAPVSQDDTEVADGGSVDCFFEANATHVLCQQTRASVAIKLGSKVAPSQTAVSAK